MKFGRKISVVKIILLKEKWLSVFIKKFEYYWVSFMIYGNIYIYSWEILRLKINANDFMNKIMNVSMYV
jgi:hypothetical protein